MAAEDQAAPSGDGTATNGPDRGGRAPSRAHALSREPAAQNARVQAHAPAGVHDTSPARSGATGADVVRMLVRLGFARVPGRPYIGISKYEYRVDGLSAVRVYLHHEDGFRCVAIDSYERNATLGMDGGDACPFTAWSLQTIEALVVEAIEAAEGRA